MQVEYFKQLREIFDAALELASEQRREFVLSQCANNNQLANEVFALLEQEEKSQHAQTLKALHIASEAMFQEQAQAQIGKHVGRYELLEEIGSGGMGRVYKAKRIDGEVTQTVAIKRLKFFDQEPEFARRFARERQILAALQHPNIARFLDAGTDAEGLPFVAIEYIEGLSILEYAKQHQLSLEARLRLLLKVMQAVAYSHRQLVLHRDIKSNNVLVDQKGEPFLLDFGIAKPIQAFGEQIVDASGDTAIEHRIFTLAHAAPEQLRGSNIGTGCDVYGLGVLAYELISGAPPFALDGLSYSEAEKIILEQFPTPPSFALTPNDTAPDGGLQKQWRAQLRGDLDNIILHALKKYPEERYPTVDAFAGDLQRFLSKEPISLRSNQQIYRLKQFIKRNRLAVALGAGLFLALSISSLMLWLQNQKVEAQRDAFEQQRDLAVAQSKRAESLNSVLMGAFDAADPSRNQGQIFSAREVLDQAARRAKVDSMDAATRVALLTSIAAVYKTLGAARESADAANLAIKTEGEMPTLLKAKAWRSLAEAQLMASDLDATRAALKAAKSIVLEPGILETQEEYVEQELVRLQIRIGEGKAVDVIDEFAGLYELAKRNLGPSHKISMRCGVSLAEQLRMIGRTDESGALVKALLSYISDPTLDPIGVRLLGAKARGERGVGQIELAKKSAEEHLKGVVLLFGERHRSFVSALDLIASIQELQGDFAAAAQTSERILQTIDQISLEPETGLYALALNNLANLQLKADQLDQGKLNASRALEISLKRFPADNPNISSVRNTLADILIRRKEFANALELLRHSETALAKITSPNSPGLLRATGHILMAEALLGLNRVEEANIAYAKGWQKIKTLEADHVRVIHAERVRLKLIRAGISTWP